MTNKRKNGNNNKRNKWEEKMKKLELYESRTKFKGSMRNYTNSTGCNSCCTFNISKCNNNYCIFR